jgi:hypothetical protein
VVVVAGWWLAAAAAGGGGGSCGCGCVAWEILRAVDCKVCDTRTHTHTHTHTHIHTQDVAIALRVHAMSGLFPDLSALDISDSVADADVDVDAVHSGDATEASSNAAAAAATSATADADAGLDAAATSTAATATATAALGDADDNTGDDAGDEPEVYALSDSAAPREEDPFGCPPGGCDVALDQHERDLVDPNAAEDVGGVAEPTGEAPAAASASTAANDGQGDLLDPNAAEDVGGVAEPTGEAPAAVSAPTAATDGQGDVRQLHVGERATYTRGDETLGCTVVKTHFDDHPPYYTVLLDSGGERQIPRSRLIASTDADDAPPTADADDAPPTAAAAADGQGTNPRSTSPSSSPSQLIRLLS